VGSACVLIVLELTAVAVCPARYASLEALAVFLLAIRFPAVAPTMRRVAVLILDFCGSQWHVWADSLVCGLEGKGVS
jgi:hypothetical protein